MTRTFRHWPERVLALALARRGHRVWSIGTRDPGRPGLDLRSEIVDGLPVFRVRSGYWPNLDLSNSLQQGPRPDVVHLMHPRNVLAAQVTAWARKRRIPTVYTWLGPLHDEYLVADRERPLEAPLRYDRPIFGARQLCRRLLVEGRPRDGLRNYRLHWPLRAAAALAPCSSFEEGVMARFGLGQPQAVVPLWIDIPFVRDTPRRPPAIDLPRPWLLFVGQLTPRKGYDIAVRAFARVLSVHPNASFLVVSGLNPAGRESLFRLAAHEGVESRVHMLGYLPDDELVNLYRAVDALLFPSRYEGFGLPLLEAMAAECPIVATDVPVANEIVQDGQNGLLLPYGDADGFAAAVIRLVDDPTLRRRLVEGGLRTLAERYQEDDLATRLEALYARVIGEPADGVRR